MDFNEFNEPYEVTMLCFGISNRKYRKKVCVYLFNSSFLWTFSHFTMHIPVLVKYRQYRYMQYKKNMGAPVVFMCRMRRCQQKYVLWVNVEKGYIHIYPSHTFQEEYYGWKQPLYSSLGKRSDRGILISPPCTVHRQAQCWANKALQK